MYPEELVTPVPERPARPLEERLVGPVALLVNTRARLGAAAFERARSALGAYGVVAAARAITDPRNLASAIDQAAAAGARTVIIGGGDGSIRSVVSRVLHHDLTLGIVPLGTGNDFARSLGIPLEIGAACGVIARGRTLEADVGLVNGRPFLNAVSVGVSAECARRLDADHKRRFGVLAYPLAAIEAGSHARPLEVKLTVDGERLEATVLQLVVGNSRYQGGGRLIDPDATPLDHTLHLYAVRGESTGPARWVSNVWRLGRVGWLTRSGRHAQYPHVLLRRGCEISLETACPAPLDLDGELVGSTPARFSVLSQALRVRVAPHAS
jgi:diacylglycerol kinase (ATP)